MSKNMIRSRPRDEPEEEELDRSPTHNNIKS